MKTSRVGWAEAQPMPIIQRFMDSMLCAAKTIANLAGKRGSSRQPECCFIAMMGIGCASAHPTEVTSWN